MPVTTRRFSGAGGLSIAADVAGNRTGAPVVLMHGGGQTRHSWKNGLRALAADGHHVISLDSRGHGESAWAPDGDYEMDSMIADLHAVLSQIEGQPILVGASMGGITALAAVGECEQPIARALVLVDVTPKLDNEGTRRIGEFMRANPDGFESLEQVADAVAAYNPHRPRPSDISGLRKNLREVDGRLYWHWDPAFIGGRRFEPDRREDRLSEAARNVRIPTLLVRGGRSEIVGEAEAAHFRSLMPSAEYVDVADAGHMVAGDRNDAFNAAILEFVRRVGG
jgi:pimeloyl-ACP methyl ester carboxylesterase